MAMLAEPRKRQKFSVNPRGTDWVNDESKFGQKLMERMGWTKGKGLGANEDGRQENVKVKFKDDNTGVGCTKSYANNWIAHQDDFNSLLTNLNNNNDNEVPKKETVKVSSLEENSKSSRKRVHYQKFTKGKDLSTRSVHDLNCIFGIKDSKVDIECQVSPEDTGTTESGDTHENNHGLITTTSSSSVQEYFAQKMADKLRSRSQVNQPEKDEAIKTKELVSDADGACGVGENISQIDDPGRRKNKKKKSKKSKSDKADDTISSRVHHETRSTEKEVDVEIVDDDVVNRKSKKKKTKNVQTIDCMENIEDTSECIQNEEPPKRRSKKKKRKSSAAMDESMAEKTSVEPDAVLEIDVAVTSALSECITKTKKKSKSKTGDQTSGGEGSASKKKNVGNDTDTVMENDVAITSASSECITKSKKKSKSKIEDRTSDTECSASKKIKASKESDTIVENNVTITTSLSKCKTKTKKISKKKAGKNNAKIVSDETNFQPKLELEMGDSSKVVDSCEDIQSANKKQVGLKKLQNVCKDTKSTKRKGKRKTGIDEVENSGTVSHCELAEMAVKRTKSENLCPVSSLASNNVLPLKVGKNDVKVNKKKKSVGNKISNKTFNNVRTRQPKLVKKKKNESNKKITVVEPFVIDMANIFRCSYLKSIPGYGSSVGT